MKDFFPGPRPLRLDHLALPPAWRLLVLAPHPDDFEAMGVSLRYLRDRGHVIHLLVLSSSANGVEDSFCRPPTPEAKASLREDEQRAGCRFFGLPESRLEFLRLPVDSPGGFMIDVPDSFERVKKCAEGSRPDLFFLPCGNDTNSDHKLTYLWWRRLAETWPKPAAAFLVRDPKTIEMRDDIYMPFDENAARWKAELLRFHKSQQQRNLNVRGHGFDERILKVNRDNAFRLRITEPYAESFALEFR
jgi:LmbE family N-acetylglucosaminyl deacetylase